MGFYMTLAAEQPEGNCVWGPRTRFLVTGKLLCQNNCVSRIVLPMCWDFLDESRNPTEHNFALMLSVLNSYREHTVS